MSKLLLCMSDCASGVISCDITLMYDLVVKGCVTWQSDLLATIIHQHYIAHMIHDSITFLDDKIIKSSTGVVSINCDNIRYRCL